MLQRLLFCFTFAAAGLVQAHAAEFLVTVAGIERLQGRILVALCAAEHYARQQCAYGGSVAADATDVVVPLRDVPAGRYAVLVLQDLDGDGRLKRSLIGMPLEPFGFGNDAPVRLGPPAFEKAAVDISAGGGVTAVRLRYR
jgi:uncharacterized protein (DUF2141 family)